MLLLAQLVGQIQRKLIGCEICNPLYDLENARILSGMPRRASHGFEKRLALLWATLPGSWRMAFLKQLDDPVPLSSRSVIACDQRNGPLGPLRLADPGRQAGLGLLQLQARTVILETPHLQ